jgi:hypothetical protein
MSRFPSFQRCRARLAILLAACGLGASLASGAAHAQAGAPVDPHFVGTHVHDIAKDAPLPPPSVQSIRLWDSRVTWKDLEPQKGEWHFDALDHAVARLTDSHREILMPLALSPTWASSNPTEPSPYGLGNAAPPAKIGDWEDYVRRVAARYKGRVTHYEIWNEPNRKKFYSGDVQQLVALTCAAQRILKETDPANVVISPSATDQKAGLEWVDQFLAAGGGRCVDAIGFHFYVLAHEPAEAIVPLVNGLRDVMARHQLQNMPLWDTEFGWYIKNGRVPNPIKYKQLEVREAGDYLLRSWILQASLGIARAYQYAWDDKQMGVLEPDDNSPKAFAAAFTTAVQWLSGARVSPCVNSGKQWRCPVTLASGQKGVFWWTTDASSPTPRLAANEAAIPAP